MRASSLVRTACVLVVLAAAPPSRAAAQAGLTDGDIAALLTAVVRAVAAHPDSGQALWVDVESFRLAARSLARAPLADSLVTSAVGHSARDVHSFDLADAVADPRRPARVLHLRLSGLWCFGSSCSAYVAYTRVLTRETGVWASVTEEHLFFTRRNGWRLQGRTVLLQT